MIDASGLPIRHLGAVIVLKNGPWQDCLNKLVTTLDSGFVIALLGPRGTGKTQLATELCRHSAFENQKSVRYVRAMDIFMAVKDTYRKDGPPESAALGRFLKCRLLVIDEAHERGDTEWEDRMLSYIVDRRYGDVKDTLLISNSDVAGFKASIGASIHSRLVETGGIIVCDWKSYRSQGATP